MNRTGSARDLLSRVLRRNARELAVGFGLLSVRQLSEAMVSAGGEPTNHAVATGDVLALIEWRSLLALVCASPTVSYQCGALIARRVGPFATDRLRADIDSHILRPLRARTGGLLLTFGRCQSLGSPLSRLVDIASMSATATPEPEKASSKLEMVLDGGDQAYVAGKWTVGTIADGLFQPATGPCRSRASRATQRFRNTFPDVPRHQVAPRCRTGWAR